tara:strand:+ start:950 stop:1294 length:345 start_codon:yes stop_codon:yes gene_type:complete
MKELTTIEDVCRVAKCSRTTLYRRLKKNPHGKLFPKPKKVPATSNFGPRTVNRWDYSEVMSWLLQGNDPKWAKQPVKTVEENKEDQSWYKKHELVITSVSGGLLAGIALYVFGK